MSVLKMSEKACAFRYVSVSEAELLPELISLASEGGPSSHVYAMLTDKVVIGIFENMKLWIGYAKDKKNYEVNELLSAEYLREIRIFNDVQEVKAVRIGAQFKIRLLQDGQRVEENGEAGRETLSCLQETHKLWGSAVHHSQSTHHGSARAWTPLVSDRGTTLYFPEHLPERAEKGVIIRNYIKFDEEYVQTLERAASSSQSLYRFIDERMVDFENWGLRGGSKDGE